MKRKTKKSFLTIFIMVLVLVLVVGFLNINSQNFDDANFCVEYKDKTFSERGKSISLPCEDKAVFYVKNCDSFTVKVVPNYLLDEDINYYVNNEEFSFFEEKDFTYYFDITITANGFSINCDNDLSLVGVLSRLWGDVEVVCDTNVEYPFLLVVSNGQEDIEIQLSQMTGQINDIELNYNQIIF